MKHQHIAGGPAFPVPDLSAAGLSRSDHNPGTNAPGWPGASLRDLFAIGAMAGDWAAQDDNSGVWETHDDGHQFDDLLNRAKLYYRMADAMLEARENGEEPDDE